jgi:hypothetical protein
MSGKSDGDAIKAIDDAMASIDDTARARIATWFNSKFGAHTPQKQEIASTGKPPARAKPPKSLATKKSKSVLKQVKDLDLRPKGSPSAVDFATEKQPTNLKQKCTLAVHYISRVLELEPVTVSHVYTFFKELSWPAPSDLTNTLQQAGSEGWLDTANAEDLKVTTRGENLIDHQLPVAKKKN